MTSYFDQIDPAQAWKPASRQPWNLKWAAHLYRRAAYGAPLQGMAGTKSSWSALQAVVQQGMEASVEQLLEGGSNTKDFDELMDDIGGRLARDGSELAELQGWWLYRMVYTPHPLRERMTLFWHNHFATSIAKVALSSLMFQQNQLLRRHALGGFRKMLVDMGRDPAMLVWLDSNSNIKGQPNENYAREVMELFSLGEGNYTESDIAEVARAFTGWSTANGKFVFKADRHDDGPKKILGQTGRWDGNDVVRILLDQPAAARFIAGKLFHHFVSENHVPPDALLEPLAAQLRKSDYDVAGCLRTILRSRLFYSENAYRQRIKSPVEYVVGLLRSFDAKVPMRDLAGAMDGLGQSLFEPPNVKGWDGGKTWLNSATLIARHNLAWRLIGGSDFQFADKVSPVKLIDENAKPAPGQIVDFLLGLLLQEDIGPERRDKLTKLVAESDTENDRDSVLRTLTHTIILMPEYQLA